MRTALFLAGLLFVLPAFRPLPVSPDPNTVLTGKVSDEKGEALIGASVKVLQNETLVRGTVTDYNGEYRLSLDPGVYDVEFAYTGYKPNRIAGVQVISGQINFLNTAMTEGTVLSEVVITEYKVPLIQQDQTSAGQTLTTGSVWPASASGSGKVRGNRSGGRKEEPQAPSYASGGAVGKKGRPLKTLRDTLPPEQGTEQYNAIMENPFVEVAGNPLSTFSIDVDAASYSNVRRFINSGRLPPADAVRIEEMINYFDYQYDAPRDGRPFAVHTELAACPWQPGHQLLLLNLQGQKIDTGQLPASNLVFLVDVSGSMESPDKLPLVIESLDLLTDQLRPQDRVAIVVYAGAAGLVLPSTPGDQKETIKLALTELKAGGSTAGGAGIQLAYQTAREQFIPGGNNRVILCTDGDFNVGVSQENDLVNLIEKERESGIYLTVLGFGEGNYQDGKMQSLADKGNGNHAYIDRIEEARKVLVSEFGGTLFTIAKDVKIQIEFNPAKVAGYRLIGYENRLLNKEDFNDDTKDAGELGAGHRVTALYEIVPAGQATPVSSVDPLKYQTPGTTTPAALAGNELATIKLRYKAPKGNRPSQLIEFAVPAEATATPGENFELAASVAEFGLLLRNSKYKGNASWKVLSERTNRFAQQGNSTFRRELAGLIDRAWQLSEPMSAKN
ncbi:MAG: von Willebrand factor type A domain-containing protein [Saprospiraceae bacterium]